jgi:cell division protein FtsQ
VDLLEGRPEREPEEHFLRGQLRVRRASAARGRLSWTRLARVGLFLVLAGVLAGAIGWSFLREGSPELSIDRILVVGNDRLTEGEILELIEVSESTNILTLDLDETRGKLLRSTWVKNVELKRVLPATLTLTITERTPVAVAVLSSLYLLAEDGTILDQVPPFYDLSKLVLVDGIGDENGSFSAERAALAGRLAAALLAEERLSLVVSEMDVADGPRSVKVRLRDSTVSLLVSETSMVSRLLETVPLIAGLSEKFPSVGILDLRFEHRVYARRNQPLPGGEPF